MDKMDNLPEVNLQDKDGKWLKCRPILTTVKGGKAIIYVTPDGTEIKREPLARYAAREARKTNETKTDSKVKAIMEALILDLSDRRGLKNEWDAMDADVKEEIKETWSNIIKSKLMK